MLMLQSILCERFLFLSPEINYCKEDPCVNGECVNGVGTYKCECYIGYTGETCDAGNYIIY